MKNIISYNEFTQKVRKFTKNSVLHSTTSALWKVWDNQNTELFNVKETKLGKEMFYVRSYGPRIALLAALSNNHNRSQATEKDIVSLCRQYAQIEETIINQRFFDNVEVPKLTRLLAEGMPEVAIKDTPDFQSIARNITAELFPIRLMASQWAHIGFTLPILIRSWKIFQYLDKRVNGEATSKLSKYFNANPKDLIVAGFGIFSMFNSPNDMRSKGVLNLNESTVLEEAKERYDFDINVVKLLANRMSRDTQAIREWHESEVLSLNKYYRRYAPICLVESPLIKFDFMVNDPDSRHKYFLPSPWHFMWCLSRILFDHLNNAFKESQINIRSELGGALQEYVDHFLNFHFENQYLEFDNLERQGLKPDFAIKVNPESAILIEVKNCIGSKFDKSTYTPENILATWRRLWKALQQCKSIQLNEYTYDLGNISSTVGIICINEEITSEAVSFQKFIELSGLLKNSHLKGFEVFSLNNFEFYMLKLGPRQLFKLIEKKWSEKKGSYFFYSYLEQEMENLIICDQRFAPHLEEASKSLFPDTEMPIIGNVI